MFKKTLVILGRKALSLALIFNFIASLISSLSILYSHYLGKSHEELYKPYLADGSLFWFVVLTSVLNIVPARMLGKVNIRRILFHHYVYGFLSIFISVILSILLSLLHVSNFQYSQSFIILLLYWGITLIIDDMPDVSPIILRILNRIKKEVYKMDKMIAKVHLISSFISTYVATCIFLWYFGNNFLAGNYPLLDFTYSLFIVNLFITALYGLKTAKKGIWLKYL